jgi:hypothetical protein
LFARRALLDELRKIGTLEDVPEIELAAAVRENAGNDDVFNDMLQKAGISLEEFKEFMVEEIMGLVKT